jgi:hypothetical protein
VISANNLLIFVRHMGRCFVQIELMTRRFTALMVVYIFEILPHTGSGSPAAGQYSVRFEEPRVDNFPAAMYFHAVIVGVQSHPSFLIP